MATRWRTGPRWVKARNTLGFHVDAKYIRRGLKAAAKEGGRWIITEGSDLRKRNVSLRLGTELLFKGAGLTLADYGAVLGELAADHLRFSELVQEVFLGILKGIGAVRT